jgi:septum formation protein
MTPRLILASASPRRSEVLKTLGLAHEVLPARTLEEVRPGEPPEAYVERLAREKAAYVARQRPDALVLGGDTEVVLDGEVLGKPGNLEHAVEMLLRLSGRTHTVLSGLALADPSGALHTRVERAEVAFRPLERGDALAYAETGEPLDKAGGYGIQGLGAALVTWVRGDYYTVVGLPVGGLLALLEEAGWRYRFPRLVPVPGRSPSAPPR